MTVHNIYIEPCGKDFELTVYAINDMEDTFVATYHGFFASHEEAMSAAKALRATYPFYTIFD